MSGKTSLDFILNPTAEAAHVAGLLDLHKFPSAMLPLPATVAFPLALGLGVQPLRADEKRFIAIRPKAPTMPTLVLSPVGSTDGESAGDDEDDDDGDDDESIGSHDHDHANAKDATRKRKKLSKKKTAMCKEPGCVSLAVSRRSCVRHGGGSRCVVDGCNNGAKLRNRCFQHGGSTICLADGCDSKAKRYGYCWCHGGGRICSADDCNKVAAQGGLCWAHGGRNRCKLEGCTKRSYLKHGYFCKRHAMYSPQASTGREALATGAEE